MQRPKPHQLDTTGATDGDVLTYQAAADKYAPAAPAPAGVQTIVQGPGTTVDNTDPLHPVVSALVLEPLTTEIGGVPDLVWDDNNILVMTEAL